MICLDTNYLIHGLVGDTPEAARIIAWARSGETLVTAMPSWFEFICGPVTPPQIATMRAFLHAIIPFDEDQAAEAARLFNAAGRLRRLRVDAMIAGSPPGHQQPRRLQTLHPPRTPPRLTAGSRQGSNRRARLPSVTCSFYKATDETDRIDESILGTPWVQIGYARAP